MLWCCHGKVDRPAVERVQELFAAGNRAAFGKTYNVASEEILSLDDFVRLTASILGVRDPVVTVRSPRGGGRPRDA